MVCQNFLNLNEYYLLGAHNPNVVTHYCLHVMLCDVYVHFCRQDLYIQKNSHNLFMEKHICRNILLYAIKRFLLWRDREKQLRQFDAFLNFLLLVWVFCVFLLFILFHWPDFFTVLIFFSNLTSVIFNIIIWCSNNGLITIHNAWNSGIGTVFWHENWHFLLRA